MPMLFRMLFCSALILLIAAPSAVAAKEDEPLSPCADLLETAGTGSACVLENGRVMLQFAFEREREEDTSITFPLALLRIGFRPDTELHIAAPSVKRTFENTATTSSTDLGLGLKHVLISGRTVVSLVADSTFPTSGQPEAAFTWQGGLAAGYAVTHRVNFVANLLLGHDKGTAESPATRLIVGLGAEFEPSEQTEFEIELQRDGARSSDAEVTMQRLIGPNAAVRLGLEQSSRPDGRSSAVSFGLTLLK